MKNAIFAFLVDESDWGKINFIFLAKNLSYFLMRLAWQYISELHRTIANHKCPALQVFKKVAFIKKTLPLHCPALILFLFFTTVASKSIDRRSRLPFGQKSCIRDRKKNSDRSIPCVCLATSIRVVRDHVLPITYVRVCVAACVPVCVCVCVSRRGQKLSRNAWAKAEPAPTDRFPLLL